MQSSPGRHVGSHRVVAAGEARLAELSARLSVPHITDLVLCRERRVNETP